MRQYGNDYFQFGVIDIQNAQIIVLHERAHNINQKENKNVSSSIDKSPSAITICLFIF